MLQNTTPSLIGDQPVTPVSSPGISAEGISPNATYQIARMARRMEYHRVQRLASDSFYDDTPPDIVRDSGGHIFSVGEFRYSYDARGRLTHVHQGDKIFEEYAYNARGQRIRDMPGPADQDRHFTYDARGRCTRAGGIQMTHDASGKLASRTQAHYTALAGAAQRIMQLSYGDDTRLDSLTLPSGGRILYHYKRNGLMPLALHSTRAKCEVFLYDWEGQRLRAFCNVAEGAEYEFQYADAKARVPHAATVRGGWLADRWGKHVTLRMRYNYIHTLEHVFVDLPYGKRHCIKSVVHNAFGVRLLDTKPEWYFPLGFAGGWYDPYTSFVRFGFRDYDPAVGRFTCPDPARDMRGDGDLYDYCADDPVNYIDTSGLAWSHEAAAAGGQAHAGVSHPFGASHGSGGGASNAKSIEHGLRKGLQEAAKANTGAAPDAKLVAATANTATDASAQPAKRPITIEEGQGIAQEAARWVGTPYHQGQGEQVRGTGADCSGSTAMIFRAVGLPYGPDGEGRYWSTRTFKEMVIDAEHPNFMVVPYAQAQPGDVYWWEGHMAICADPDAEEDIYTARTFGRSYTRMSSAWWRQRNGVPIVIRPLK